MTVKHKVDAKTLGKRYAELVRERNLPVRSVWAGIVDDVPHLWVVTHSITLEQMRPVYEARLALRQSFPVAEFDFNTINPDWTPGVSPEEQIPSNAHMIEPGA